MAKVLCVLYDDPVDGYPTGYARDGVPHIERYVDGQTAPTPQAIGFQPGELLGSVARAKWRSRASAARYSSCRRNTPG